jgi:hypothetical protein
MIIKILLAILVLLLPSIAQSQTQVSVSAGYHNRSCLGGTGFCSDTGTINLQKNGNASIAKKDNNHIIFYIKHNQLSSKELEELRTTKTFVINPKDIAILDVQLLKTLKIENNLNTIVPNVYEVSFYKDYVSITFELYDIR